MPVAGPRLTNVCTRSNDDLHASHSVKQFQRTEAPPPPEQKDTLLVESLVDDPAHMSQQYSIRHEHTHGGKSQVDLAPPRRSMFYPVVVPVVEDNMERPEWRPQHMPRGGVHEKDKRRNDFGETGRSTLGSAGLQMSARGEKWPPIGSHCIDIRIVCAKGLPKADRSGHSDPYAVCYVPGKPKSKVKTKVIEDTEDPVWRQEFILQGWKKGDPLTFSVFDHDKVGADDMLATLQLPSERFYPEVFEGTLALENTWSAGGERCEDDLKRFNLAATPMMDVRIRVHEEVVKSNEEGLAAEGAGTVHLGMPGHEPTMGHVCQHLDEFEQNLKPVPRLGNFWMTPR